MKISNETKVGALTAIAITVLILGFSYLKGRSLTERKDEIYAIFPSVHGLAVSNAVVINGLQVGKVSKMRETDKNLTGILVSIDLVKDINIPKNSIATINSELLGSSALNIVLGDGTNYIKDGDTLQTRENVSVMGEFTKSVNPAINNVTKTLASLEILIRKLSEIVDPTTKNNIQSVIANLTQSSRSLTQLMDAQTGLLAKTLVNTESVTGNLAKNNEKINNTLTNLETTSRNLSNAKIDETLQSLRNTMAKLENSIAKIDSKNGTLGLLLNDTKLYDELRQTNRSLTTLLDDVRYNPKRYVNISVFGKKDKNGPLKAPLYDSTTKK